MSDKAQLFPIWPASPLEVEDVIFSLVCIFGLCQKSVVNRFMCLAAVCKAIFLIQVHVFKSVTLFFSFLITTALWSNLKSGWCYLQQVVFILNCSGMFGPALFFFFFFKEKFNIILFNFSMENCVGIDRNCVESVRLLSVGWPFSQPHSYKE